MAGFILRRLLGMIAVLFAISVITFAIFNVIPNGDPAVRIAGHSAQSPAALASIRREFGFNKPVYVQYVRTMGKIFDGSLISYSDQTNVDSEIRGDLGPTISLAVGAALLWMLFALCLGLFTATRAGKFSDRFLTVLALIGVSMPVFWVGALLSYYLGFKAGIFPNGGYVNPSQPTEWLYHMILPWTALSILYVGVYSRLIRSNILDTINEDFVRTARAKGLSERRVMVRHVLRNSLIPVISLWGLDFGAVIGGGALVTESVFNLGGVGQYAADSIGNLDVPPVMALTIFIAFFVVLFNTIVDIMYAWLDPRIRLA
jgi:peptide/nickel transport system permease protein